MAGGKGPKPGAATPAAVPGRVPKLWEDEAEPASTPPTGFLPKTSGISLKRTEASPAKRAVLLVMSGSAAGRVLLLESLKLTIGRSRQADLTLHEEGVSRMHCGIAVQGTAYLLTDLGSTHGTLVNGERVERIELRPGDRIQLGPDTLLEFDLFDAAEQGVLDRLYQGATRDLLTRALNRRAFEERLAAEVSFAVRHRAGLCAVAVEIDRLDDLEVAHGAAARDVALREVSAVIASMLRGEDVLARTRSNGFVILARGLSARDGASLADRMRKLVEERTFAFADASLNVTISAGVGELAENAPPSSGNALLDLAEARLAAAKLAGSNRVSGES